jgi:hypothetical protein
MDINVALHPGLSVAAHIARERERDANDMPANNGWRLGHSKQPKKQPKKESTVPVPLKAVRDSPPVSEPSADRRRQPSWLKTRSASRPGTPVSGITTTPTLEDTGKWSQSYTGWRVKVALAQDAFLTADTDLGPL